MSLVDGSQKYQYIIGSTIFELVRIHWEEHIIITFQQFFISFITGYGFFPHAYSLVIFGSIKRGA